MFIENSKITAQPQFLLRPRPDVALVTLPIGQTGIEVVSGSNLAWHYTQSAILNLAGAAGRYITTTDPYDDSRTNSTAVDANLAYRLPGRTNATIVTNFFLAASRASTVFVFTQNAGSNLCSIEVNTSGNVIVKTIQATGSTNTFTSTASIAPGIHTIALEAISLTGSESRDFLLWVDGTSFGSFSQLWYSPWAYTTGVAYGFREYATTVHGPTTAQVYTIAIIQGVGKGSQVSKNPWPFLFYDRVSYKAISATAITLVGADSSQAQVSDVGVVYKFPVQPGTDITTTGWTSTAGSLAAAINEFPSDDASYITSPWIDGGQGPAITTLDQPLPAGTWGITVRAKATLATSQVRIHLLDSSNTILGTSSWQTLTTSYADYALNITTSVVATRIQYEVQ